GGGGGVFWVEKDGDEAYDTILFGGGGEEWDKAPADIRVLTADTDLTPVDLGSYSSRVTVMTGNAAIQACGKLKPLLLEAASEALEIPVDDLEFADGKVRSASLHDRAITFAEAVTKAEGKHGTSAPPAGIGRPRTRAASRARPSGRRPPIVFLLRLSSFIAIASRAKSKSTKCGLHTIAGAPSIRCWLKVKSKAVFIWPSAKR